MNPISTALGKQLKQELASSSRIKFQEICYKLLKGLFPSMVFAAELGKIDSSGIDLFTFDQDTEKIQKGFQCKGFEVSEFGSLHLNQCLKT